MRSAAGKSFRYWVVGLAASGLVGCNINGGIPQTPEAKACRETIQSKTQALKNAGVDVDHWSFADAPEMAELVNPAQQTPETYQQFDGKYRPLTNHPGCSVQNLYYDKASSTYTELGSNGNNDGTWTGNSAYGGPNAATNFIDGDRLKLEGYDCAAKVYTQANPDTSKPIVILVQGNSTRPHTWEKFLLPAGKTINTAVEKVQFSPDTEARDQLAEKLIAARYEVIAVDFRTDLVFGADPSANSTSENQAGNIDHGWATPILQSLIKAVMKKNPDRKVSLVSHSLGVTVARDALRRLFWEYVNEKPDAINPFPQLQHVIMGSGANHGVSTYDAGLCQGNKTMRGTIVCEMGSRSNYVQTYFHKPLNGPDDLFATPCADGDYAFGTTGKCGGNAVKYVTITMTDVTEDSNYQDYYVSQKASRINMEGCVTNELNSLEAYDTSGYFGYGFIANHFGSMRSEEGLAKVMDYLSK